MVETLLATFATTAGTASAAAAGSAAIAGPVTAAASGAAALSTVLSTGFSLLSGVGTIAGALGQIGAGNQSAAAYRDQARQSVLNSRVEKVNAEEKANELRRALLATVASSKAIYASRGIGLGSGTPDQARAESARNASINIDKARFSGDFAANSDIIEAGQSRRNASAARVGGYGSAALTLSSSRALRSMLDR